MPNGADIYLDLSEVNENARTLDGFESAYLGVSYRCGREPIACYSRPKCIEVLMKRDGMTEEDAEDFFEFNVIGAWVGDGTPCFLEPNS